MKEPIILKNKGLQYIQHLLHNKNKEFYASGLRNAVEGLSSDTLHNVYGKSSYQQPDGEHLSPIPNGIPVELRKLKKRKEEIKEEIDEAKKNNDLSKIRTLLEELNEINEKLEEGTSTFEYKNRKYLDTTIRRALDAIKKASGEDLSLYNHLTNHFKSLTYPLKYSPEEEINWNTGL